MTFLKMYDTFPIEIERAKGVYIFDKKGQKYLDTFAGIGVMSLGHSNPGLLETIKSKLERYMHVSNFFLDEDTLIVSQQLVKFTEKNGSVYFTNSGTEATEAALKAIKKRATPKRNKIIYFENAFHGRTLGSLSINGFKNLREPFEPLIPNTVELKFNDIDDLSNFFDSFGEETLAVFVEPILGSGGVIPIKLEFARAIERYKERYNFILVCDEIQSGLGRTGKIFAYQHYSLSPDIITVAKSLGGGLPLGATIFLENISQAFEKGEHGSTFSPNPVATAGARYILEKLPSLLEDVAKKGEYIIKGLKNKKISRIKEIRGKGLMLGIELKESMPNIINEALDLGLLLNVVKGKVIRLLPALNIEYEEIDEMIDKLEVLLK
ncbi:MAG: aspartate aminotransferase family protein [Defluviitoga tunisiensis]|jgi:acetylornithine/N-succinyldiaminopimelate aminotransferase|uniref:Acetylornithine aminotransferase n=1 Tax=Defluviitoga tunisiensis TaxID=1006576 RepID=A0A0C7P476_DEFTU|nr:aspartate aminotransferase family protein [Defluviitoga tunisiensis]MDD3600644.1 aspartate aminotransferase family protein [Defluviitoga tunisiensis]MDY0378965.1 aspartate aminotransferase family protein [Defluviitoga tunisiensis]CEP79135.1 acetylornithine aminotransferase [Defluviitoga tunisiensis]HHV01844.1 aspartate aminotransferase family protein [Defluviitoga tunisiensis]HOB55227.1 aspartate aminotransferase family protein [Defluviitoga tunisiensis]